MESSLTFSSITALFGVMVVGAAIPSVSVLTVSARSAAFGFSHGVLTTMGIVVGDIIFILLAMFGLSIVVELTGSHFSIVKYLGGAYLLWLGIALWRANAEAEGVEGNINSSRLSSFMTGLLITLGDQKAIFFYLGFLPAFIDLSAVSFTDTGIIIVMATLAICGVKLFYAFMADRASLIFKKPRAMKRLNIISGCAMICVGVILIMKA